MILNRWLIYRLPLYLSMLALTLMLAACGGDETEVAEPDPVQTVPATVAVEQIEPTAEVVEPVETETPEVAEEPTDDPATPDAEVTPAVGVGASAEAGTWGIQDAPVQLVRATIIFDYDVQNAAGESIGTVTDFVLDLSTGQVPYVILQTGGLLTLGATEHAVPPTALRWAAGVEPDTGAVVVDEALLDVVPSVEDRWHDFEDLAWDPALRDYWAQLGHGVQPEALEEPLLVRASHLIGFQVGDIGYGLGRIEEMMVNIEAGQVPFLFVGYDDARVVDDLIAMPLRAFIVDRMGGNVLLFNPEVGEAVLAEAPRIPRTIFAEAYFDPTLDDQLVEYWQHLGDVQ